MKTYYYSEKDGEVFLIRKSGVLTLPQKKELPFRIKSQKLMPIKEAKIYYCNPDVPFPSDWVRKDSVPGRRDVSTLARLAVNRSLVRHVSDAIILRNGKVLMVKGNRGYTKDLFSLPGGFINFGESPEESLVREVKEEIGVDIRVDKLVGAYTHTFLPEHHYAMAFIYLCTITKGKITPDPEEISEVVWLPIDDAIKETGSVFSKRGLIDMKNAK